MRSITTLQPRPVKSAGVSLKPVIDFPKEGEAIGDLYTLRITAPGALAVHVAVDQGPWLECREALGFWWYDWKPETAGEHEVIACALSPGGREAVSETAHCHKTP